MPKRYDGDAMSIRCRFDDDVMSMQSRCNFDAMAMRGVCDGDAVATRWRFDGDYDKSDFDCKVSQAYLEWDNSGDHHRLISYEAALGCSALAGGQGLMMRMFCSGILSRLVLPWTSGC